MAPSTQEQSTDVQPLSKFVLYFLRLGTAGFGGPIALAARMERDLVGERYGIQQQDYLEGLALSQLLPGPLAAQLAMYLGYVRSGFLGASLVGVAFIAPSFLMVLGISLLYIRFDGLPWMQAAFHGVGAAVVAIIVRSVTKLAKTTLKKERLLWVIAATLAATTAFTGHEAVWLVLVAGLISVAVQNWPRRSWNLAVVPLIGGLFATPAGRHWEILGYFVKSSLFVFGSGLAIIPFLHGGVVEVHHWLTEQQFLDAIAVAMITPGPVVITVAFIGYLADGLVGASLAALGVFLPVYLAVILFAPIYRRLSSNTVLRSFVRGVTAAATGAIAGAIVVIARQSVTSYLGIMIAGVTYGVLWKWKLPEPLVVITAGLIGILIFR
ncbi:chromate efflux transporter [Terriglobus albidus]|uniref:Chromate efflux transporter n=1 Tax=Terriglobus albidus TaxID=1592106 RepID=A0A5B9EBS7_9BACT|nr:chromate efflux transporter [Terriglobus albidus]QEE27911.1 chromate efflux transporter [Terriglobus albidus]